MLLFAMPAAVLGIGAGGVAFTVMAVKDQRGGEAAPGANNHYHTIGELLLTKS